MNELYKEMSIRMVTTLRVANIYKGEYKNKRECPFVSELKGMEMALKTLGIEFEYEFDDNYEISAVIVQGNRTAV